MAKYKDIRKMRQPQCPDPCNCYQNDHVDLVVEGAGIRLCRLSSLCVPAEVSAFIPRVEVRQRRYENGQLVCEDERIYNSITVVHSPRHPLENQPKHPLPFPCPGPFLPGGPPKVSPPLISPEPPAGNQPFPSEPSGGQLPEPEPPNQGEQPPPPEIPIVPDPELPEAPVPPEIPSMPEPHPPPVSPLETYELLKAPSIKNSPPKKEPPIITINKRPIR